MQPRAVSSYLCLVGADVLALSRLRPHPVALAHHLAAPHSWVQSAGADAAAASLGEAALWLAAAWLAVGLIAGALSATPGALGRAAATLTRAVLPNAVYRIAVGAAGAGLVLAPVAGTVAFTSAGVACASDLSAPTAARSAALPPLPTPAWPTSASDPAPIARPAAPVLPPSTATSPLPPRASTSNAPTTPAPRQPAPSPAAARVVTVRPGDSLWSIAAARLGRQASAASITAGWRRIYRDNRAAIGASPSLIRPGQRLNVREGASS